MSRIKASRPQQKVLNRPLVVTYKCNGIGGCLNRTSSLSLVLLLPVFRLKKVLTQVSIHVSMLVFGLIRVGLEFVLPVSTISGYHY